MSRPAPRAIVFDKDGTLFDLKGSWGAFAGAFLGECARGDEALFAVLAAEAGYDPVTGLLRDGSVIMAETPERIAEVLLPHLPGDEPIPAFVARMNAAAAGAALAPAVPLEPLLSGLKGRGLALAVATNDAEAPARAHLDAAGVTGYFDLILGYDSGYGGKPGPGQILAVAEHVGTDPGTVVMVGDSLHDLMAGQAAGARCIGVLTGAADTAHLAPLAEAVLPDIGHLPDWLDGPCP